VLGLQFLKRFRRKVAASDPVAVFSTEHYQEHNRRRLEHLASLDLNLAGLSVLEVGAGIGDHTHFFLERGCKVFSTDARRQNVEVLRRRHPNLRTAVLDVDNPPLNFDEQFDVVYCYGLLYHLSDPSAALAFMARCCRRLLLLETRVSPGDTELVHACAEDPCVPSYSFAGTGCRPTRPWVFRELQRHFPFVYVPLTQPNHEEFPIDWNAEERGGGPTRSVFVASKQAISNPLFVEEIPSEQRWIKGFSAKGEMHAAD
jgi:SAM-dependent methyltransferase